MKEKGEAVLFSLLLSLYALIKATGVKELRMLHVGYKNPPFTSFA